MPEMIVKTTTTVTDPGRRTMLGTGSVMSALPSVGDRHHFEMIM